jgi:outer membrane protein
MAKIQDVIRHCASEGQGVLRPWLLGLCLCLVILLPLTCRAADEIKAGETLGLVRCIDIALKNHPTIMGAAGSLKASRTRVSQAQSGYYPQVDASSNYSRVRPGGSSITALPKGGTYDQYQDAFNLNQTIFDFGKTSASVDVQALTADASRSDLEDTTSRVILGVKQAYYGVLQASQSREANAEAVVQYEQHLDQARRF